MRIITHLFFNRLIPKLALFAALFVSAPMVQGQVLIGMNGNVAVPQYDFSDIQSSPAVGFSMNLGFASRRLPLSFGVELGIANYGNECWSDWYGWGEDAFVADYSRSNNYFSSNLFMRFEPRVLPWFRPYAEGKIGGNLFFTSETITDPVIPDDCDNVLDSYNLSRSFASSLSYGGGFMIPLNRRSVWTNSGTFLDIGAFWQRGGQAYYMVSESDAVYNSFTDMLNFRIGIHWRL